MSVLEIKTKKRSETIRSVSGLGLHRYLFILCSLLWITSENAWSQSVFPDIKPTGKAYTIVIQGGTINTVSISAGAEIGVFDGEVLVGKTVWNTESAVTVTAWQADTEQGLPGYTPGNTMSFKVHTQFYDLTDTFEVTASYETGNGTFGFGPFSAVRLQGQSNRVPTAVVSTNEINFGTLRLGQSNSQTLEVENTGDAQMSLSYSAQSGVFSWSAASVQLQKGQKHSISVTFTPNQALPLSGSLQMNTNDPAKLSIKVNLKGQGLPAVEPRITASVSQVQFGQVAINTLVNKTLALTNSGSDTLKITQISVSGTGFSGTNNAVNLAPGRSVEVKVAINSSSVGNRNGQLRIVSNATNQSDFQISLSAFVYQPAFDSPVETGRPYIVLISQLLVDNVTLSVGDQIALYAGNTVVGSSYIQSEGWPLNITAWQADASRNLAGFLPSDSIEVWVSTTRYALPVKKKISTLNFTKGNGKYGALPFTELSGSVISGNSPLVALEKQILPFDFTEIGSTSTESVKVYNIGASVLQVSPSLSGEYTINPNYQLGIQPGDSVTYTITFSPTNAGIKQSDLNFSTNDPFTSNQKIELQGRGIIPISKEPIQLSLPTVSLWEIPVGSTFETTLELYNPFVVAISGELFTNTSSDSTEVSLSSTALEIPARTRIPVKVSLNPAKTISDTLRLQFITAQEDTIHLNQPYLAFEQYFGEVKPTGRSFQVIAERLTTFGPAFRAGDQIAVYDGDVLVGTKLVSGSTVNVPITVWQKSESTSLDGFTAGNPISFKVAKVSQGYPGKFITETQSVTFTGSGKFGEGSFQVARIRVNEPPYFFWRNLNKVIESNTWENRVFMQLDTTVVDMDGTPLTFEVAVDNEGLQAELSGSNVLLSTTTDFYGDVDLVLAVKDGGYTVYDTTKITVAYRPTVQNVQESFSIYESETIEIPIKGETGLFYHPNTEMISHSFGNNESIENSETAQVIIQGDTLLVIKGLKDGTQIINLTSTEINGLSSNQEFEVTVRHPKRDWSWYLDLSVERNSETQSNYFVGASELTSMDFEVYHDRKLGETNRFLQWNVNNQETDWNIYDNRVLSDSAQTFEFTLDNSQDEDYILRFSRTNLEANLPISIVDADQPENRIVLAHGEQDSLVVTAENAKKKLALIIGDRTKPVVNLGNQLDGHQIKLWGETLSFDWSSLDKMPIYRTRIETTVDTGKTYQMESEQFALDGIVSEYDLLDIKNYNGYLSSGFKLRVLVEDIQGNTDTVYTKDWLTILKAEQERNLKQGWDLVSIPANPEFPKLDSLIKSNENLPWFAYSWNGSSYEISTEVELTQSLWLANLAPAAKAYAKGSFFSEPITKVYPPGWHLIASPYMVGIQLDSLEIKINNERISYDDAITQGKLTQLIAYDQVSAYTYSRELQPWRGAWLGVIDDSVTLTYKVHSLGLAKKRPNVQEAPDVAIDLLLKYGDQYSDLIRLGANRMATDDFDPEFDIPAPPLPPHSDFLGISILKNFETFPLGNRFIQEFRSSEDLTKELEFKVVVDNVPSESVINWDYAIPENVKVMWKKSSLSNYNDLTIGTEITVLKNDSIFVKITPNTTSSEVVDIPKQFDLGLAYPNPFNPTTTMKLSLPSSVNVTMEVYSALGQRVLNKELGVKSAGVHELDIVASDWSSGIYLIRVKAGDEVAVRRITLIK